MFIALTWPPLDLSPVEHLWEQDIKIVNVQLINLQHLCDAVTSVQIKIDVSGTLLNLRYEKLKQF